MIKITDLNFKYEGSNSYVFKNLNIKFPNTGMFLITGESGCGKTTLFNLLNGDLISEEGSISLLGQKYESYGKDKLKEFIHSNITYMLQETSLVENFTVFKNLQLLKKSDDEVNKIIKDLNLSNLKNRKCAKLSSGQRQRVAFACSILNCKQVLLLDEATANLDEENKDLFFNYLKKISDKVLVLCISHEIQLYKKYVDGIVDLNHKERVYDFSISQNEELTPLKHNPKKKILFWKNVFSFSKNILLRSFLFLLTMTIFTISCIGIYKGNDRVYENVVISNEYINDDNQLAVDLSMKDTKNVLKRGETYEKKIYMNKYIDFNEMFDYPNDLPFYDLTIDNKKDINDIYGRNKTAINEITIGINTEIISGYTSIRDFEYLIDTKVTFIPTKDEFVITGIYESKVDTINIDYEELNLKCYNIDTNKLKRNILKEFDSIKVIKIPEADIISSFKFDYLYCKSEDKEIDVSNASFKIDSNVEGNICYIDGEYLKNVIYESNLKTIVTYSSEYLMNLDIRSSKIAATNNSSIWYPLYSTQFKNFVSFIEFICIGFMICLVCELFYFFFENGMRKDLKLMKSYDYTDRSIKVFKGKYHIICYAISFILLFLVASILHLINKIKYPGSALALTPYLNIVGYLFISLVVVVCLNTLISFIKRRINYDSNN